MALVIRARDQCTGGVRESGGLFSTVFGCVGGIVLVEAATATGHVTVLRTRGGGALVWRLGLVTGRNVIVDFRSVLSTRFSHSEL